MPLSRQSGIRASVILPNENAGPRHSKLASNEAVQDHCWRIFFVQMWKSLVEARGIEPRSKTADTRASTSVSLLLIFDVRLSEGQAVARLDLLF